MMTPAAAVAVVMIAALAGLGESQSSWPQAPDLQGGVPSEGCVSGPTISELSSLYPKGASTLVPISVGGGGGGGATTREFRVHVPLAVPDEFYKAPAPLTFVIHGGLGSALQVENSTGMSAVSDANAFYVIYPEADGLAFNAGNGCCGSGPSDLDYFRAILDWAQATLCVDERRIFSTGMSNGGIMSYGLSCDADIGNRLAAIAPVAGVPVSVCPPEQIPADLSILHIHGSSDFNVPFDGGAGCGLSQAIFASVEDTLENYRIAAGCEGSGSVIFEQSLGTCVSQGNNTSFCSESVILCTIEGGGHSWPGGTPKTFFLPACVAAGEGVQDLGFQASEHIWAFFAAHPKPPPPSPPSLSPPPATSACPVNGDLNEDGVKNIQDVILLLDDIVDG